MNLKELIKKREVYRNKTLQFLIPILKYYGETFSTYIDNINRVAFLIKMKDIEIDENELPIFIIYDGKYKPSYTESFINYLKNTTIFINDFLHGNPYDRIRVLVIRFPEKYKNAYFKFKEGKYSEMYDEETINKYFVNIKTRKILKKEPNSLLYLYKEIEEEFGKNLISVEELEEKDKTEGIEYSIKPLSDYETI